MALFADGAINTTADLQDHENSILAMAANEGVDLAAKMDLARDEIGRQLLLFLLRIPSRDPKVEVRRSLGANDVVITPSLKHCHALKSIALTYRDAYNSQLNDRYLGKWKEYERLAQTAMQTYLQSGVGLVRDPLPRGGEPVLTTVPGGGASAVYYVATAWVNAAQQAGTPSDANVITTPADTQLVVRVKGCPSNATGWNVYVGPAGDLLTRQNADAIGIGMTWTLPPNGPATGELPENGQEADYYLFHDRRLQRG